MVDRDEVLVVAKGDRRIKPRVEPLRRNPGLASDTRRSLKASYMSRLVRPLQGRLDLVQGTHGSARKASLHLGLYRSVAFGDKILTNFPNRRLNGDC